MDGFILNHARENPAMDRMRRAILQTDDPGALLCVELYADRADDLPPRLDAIERDLAPFKLRLPRALIALPDQARIWGFREAVARPVDGDEGRREVAFALSRTRPSSPRCCATTSTTSWR